MHINSTEILETYASAGVEKPTLNLTDNAKTVLEHRYLTKNEKGEIVETPEQMFERVAIAISEPETELKEQATRVFEDMMVSLRFLPNSPTLMNAGHNRGLVACYVLEIKDSMESIFETLKNAALIFQQAGGVGYSFSSLRPAGDIVKTSGGYSSGPLSFLDAYNAMTEAVKGGGRRRGASLGSLRCDHPDIKDFITCKQNQDRLTNFNLSVTITDEFMEAVINNEEYNLINPRDGSVVKAEKASEIFDLICQCAHSTGDPGILFIDEINRYNPTPHLGQIETTNPCLSGDTWVLANSGPCQIKDIVHNRFNTTSFIALNGKFNKSKNGFFKTMENKYTYEISTNKGYKISMTLNHKILVAHQTGRGKITKKWKEINELKIGDKIVLSNNRGINKWNSNKEGGYEEGYLLGVWIGDGTLTREKTGRERTYISIWENEHGQDAIKKEIIQCLGNMNYKKKLYGFNKPDKNGRCHLRFKYLKNDFVNYFGINYKTGKHLREIEKSSYNFYQGFLRGFFDTDGTVIGNHKKGISVRLSQSKSHVLYSVQRMLHRLGIISTIYLNRHDAGLKLMPDGRGGLKEYYCEATHELAISKDNLKYFNNVIGFAHSVKKKKLNNKLSGYKRNLNTESFLAKVIGIQKMWAEDVYDIQIPGINAIDANGFTVHNCGEVPALPGESCCLGSINLSNHIDECDCERMELNWGKLNETVHIAIRFLDNVITVNKYPLKQIEKMTFSTRKVGLGIMGFADTLIKLGIQYDSDEGIKFASKIMKFIQDEGRSESIHLAEERGAYPEYKRKDITVMGQTIRSKPIRNATITTIAPTGSISIIAGCSSGIEPLFAVEYTRNILDGKQLKEKHPLLINKSQQEIDKLFRTAHQISPIWHLKMQAAFQEFTCQACSKTINCPSSTTIEDIKKIYLQAYNLNLKGITIYRDKSRDKQVLDKKEGIRYIEPRSRPEKVNGLTHMTKTGCGKLYVTINSDTQGLCEVFCQIGRSGGCIASQGEAIGRLISLGLRCGINPEEITHQLKGIRCSSPTWMNGKTILSCSDGIGKVLEKYINKKEKKGNEVEVKHSKGMAGVCPECGETLMHSEGCVKCESCGYSKC